VTSVDWTDILRPLFNRYQGRKHPLEYRNPYQLLVMAVLASQDTDRKVNMIAPDFFRRYPSMQELSNAKPEDLYASLRHVRNFATKARWLTHIAVTLERDENIPATFNELVKLPGIGRKTANLILRELSGPAEGILVDLHVLRVAPRIGVARAQNAEKLEEQLMAILPRDVWHDAGIAFSLLGREICRPTKPKCDVCVMMQRCEYFLTKVQNNTT
jgi:endonuclease-3